MSIDLDRNITVRGVRELSMRAGRLFGSAQREFICAAGDHTTWSKPALDAELHGDARAARDWRPPPRLRLYKLFTPAALTDPGHERHLVEVVGRGALVRISATTPPHETIIIDRRVAILAGPVRQGERTYTIVRSPDVIDGVLSLFWVAWESATDLAEFRTASGADAPASAGANVLPGAAVAGVAGGGPAPRPALGDEGRAILRLLGDGLKDEAAARALGLSLRTYRRRVAELMALLGAESRFQAGRRARELGLDG